MSTVQLISDVQCGLLSNYFDHLLCLTMHLSLARLHTVYRARLVTVVGVWHHLSLSVTLHGRPAGSSHAMTPCSLQSNYSSMAAWRASPVTLGRHLVYYTHAVVKTMQWQFMQYITITSTQVKHILTLGQLSLASLRGC